MIKQLYQEYQELGLKVISIEWDAGNKCPVSHREWQGENLPFYDKHNALMVQTGNGWASLDFDIKNTNDKELFTKWMAIVTNQRPEILNKVFIEKTRNNGYHVWIKYKHLIKKLSLADSSEGAEVIALYAEGPLVYTYPTDKYVEYHNSMQDVDYLTKDEYNYLLETSQFFNEYKPSYDPNKKAVSYPLGYEKKLISFDTLINDDTWEEILNQIGLEVIRDFRYNNKDFFTAYRRSDSVSNQISAKVYFKTKRLMLFTASMPSFPNWHNKHDYDVWALPPSFVLFYKNNRDWEETINEIDMIIDSSGIDIEQETKLISHQEFPYEIFPENIRASLFEVAEGRSLAPHFLATCGLWTISSLAGTMYKSDFNGDARNILFCLMIAPISVGKTPAYKAMCEKPLADIMKQYDIQFNADIKKWELEFMQSKNKKETFVKKKPRRFIPFAVDGTTEGYIALSMDQPNGLGVYHDEAETILNAGSYKQNNDSVSFFTQAFSGGRLTQIRADRDKERVVPNLNINLLMGTQPSRLLNVFTKDALASGFTSRFLMVESDYILLNTEVNPFAKNKEMSYEWIKIVEYLYQLGYAFNTGQAQQVNIEIGEAAKNLYAYYFKLNREQANERILNKTEFLLIGTEAKMSAYFPRLCQLIAILNNPNKPEITEQYVHFAWQLYKYYANSTIRIIIKMQGESETGLSEELELLYQALPLVFKLKDAEESCIRLNLKKDKFKNSLRNKNFEKLFIRKEHGIYAKV